MHTSDGPRGTVSVTLDTVLARWRVSVHVAGVENEESWRGLDKRTSSQCNLHSQTHVATLSPPTRICFSCPFVTTATRAMCSHVQPSVREGGTREEIRYGAWEVNRRRGDDRVTTSKQQQTNNNKQTTTNSKQTATNSKQTATSSAQKRNRQL